MKLQITFDLTNLETATTLAPTIEEFVDMVEVGSLLLFKYGEQALISFREILKEKPLVADAKIVDLAKETTTLLSNAGADWISVMAGTKKSIIHSACTTAHTLGKKAMINMLDASSPGQAALEAKSLGGDALIVHYDPAEEQNAQLVDTWEMVRGNTNLPIYVVSPSTSQALEKLIPLNPDAVIISINDTNVANAIEMITSVRAIFSLKP